MVQTILTFVHPTRIHLTAVRKALDGNTVVRNETSEPPGCYSEMRMWKDPRRTGEAGHQVRMESPKTESTSFSSTG